jgi:hypothetical protein
MKKLNGLAILSILVLFSCSSSRITTVWKDKTALNNNFNRILILALMKDADRNIQDKMEKHFAGDLSGLGYSAYSALEEYGPKAFENLTEQQAIEKIKNTGADAVITVVLLDKQKERTYVPPRTYYQRDFWDYYHVRYRRIIEPGYYITDTRYYWETNMYKLENKALIYSARTESFSPQNTESLGHEYSLMVVNNLMKQKILKQKEVPLQ